MSTTAQKPRSLTQSEQVIEIMERNNGFATLGYLNHNVDVSQWKSKTPFASIRRIVQNPKIFFKIRPGLWALNSHKRRVLASFKIENAKQKNAQEEFDHTYFQGLLAEIGNMRGLDTFVPNQDKNRLFLNKPLHQITTVQSIYEFTYPQIVSRAKTIDTIWFNRRKLPAAFFEVEHSTDFQNSFGKFVDLQDFHCEFFIVSSAKRKKEFDHKIAFDMFEPVRQRIKFIDYDFLAALHTKSFEYQKLNQIFSR
jgi:hypothetical protein